MWNGRHCDLIEFGMHYGIVFFRASNLLSGLDGKKLYQLCQMKAQAPEFFYSYVAKEQGIPLSDLLQLTQAMEELK